MEKKIFPIKECPFCGSKHILLSYNFGDYAVCQGCHANGPHRLLASSEVAARLWNKRVNPSKGK